MRLAATLLVVAGCRFVEGRVASGDDAAMPDVDDAPNVGCTPGEPVCSGLLIGVCNREGTGIDPSMSTEECTLACVDEPQPHCAAASNVPPVEQVTCIASTAPTLAPPAGGSVTITNTSGATITCNPHCGTSGMTAISRVGSVTQGVAPPFSWFCVGDIVLAAGTTLTVDPDVTDAIVLLATGDVSIDGTIALDGQSAGGTSVGAGGPGGSVGGDLSGFTGDGVPAPGACGGAAGHADTASMDGGGGGGGGNGGAGGAGGDGLTVASVGAAGGLGGAATCASTTLIPLAGGAGGGGGGDGSCGGTGRCGFPGGGGGGAIQISSRRGITVNGEIHARGGNGFGNVALQHGGAGGGGAGGAILLESWNVGFGQLAKLDVSGGNGGPSGGGAGGPGASASVNGSDGTDAIAADQGGGGGGGGAGVITINGPATCVAAVPQAACTIGTPPPAP